MTREICDIFLSYTASDRERVTPLVDALQKEGWSVWWDRRILPGESWAKVIESELNESRCVVVVWSLASIGSKWVRAEADEGWNRGILVPVHLDEVRIPLPFGQIQAANLIGWTGDLDDVRFKTLLRAIKAILISKQSYGASEAAVVSPLGSPVHPARSSTGPPSSKGPPKWLISPKAPDANGPFLMPIEDVFSISGRGIVVTGHIERGRVNVGDKVEIVGFRETRKTVVTGVEMFKKQLDDGPAGDNVGLLLRGISKEDVERGMVLAKTASIMPHTKFKGEIYVLSKEEGGRHTPFFDGYHPQFYFRTMEVTGVMEFPVGIEFVAPGDHVSLVIELFRPVAIEEGTVFAIREGGNTIGAGMVLLPLVSP